MMMGVEIFIAKHGRKELWQLDSVDAKIIANLKDMSLQRPHLLWLWLRFAQLNSVSLVWKRNPTFEFNGIRVLRCQNMFFSFWVTAATYSCFTSGNRMLWAWGRLNLCLDLQGTKVLSSYSLEFIVIWKLRIALDDELLQVYYFDLAHYANLAQPGKSSIASTKCCYRSRTANSNTVNSKFHLIQSFNQDFARFLSFHV